MPPTESSHPIAIGAKECNIAEPQDKEIKIAINNVL